MGYQVIDHFGMSTRNWHRLNRALSTMDEIRPLPFRVTVAVWEAKDDDTLADIDVKYLGRHLDVYSRIFAPEREHNQQVMPAYELVTALTYTVAHEWGHLHQLQWCIEDSALLNSRRWRTMSEYGRISPVEGYAEAFAEWYLSEGTTANRAARRYAREYDWR